MKQHFTPIQTNKIQEPDQQQKLVNQAKKIPLFVIGIIAGLLCIGVLVVFSSFSNFSIKHPKVFLNLGSLFSTNKKVNIPFSMVESSPAHFDTDFPLFGQPTFVFSKQLRVNENNISKYFSIKPNLVDVAWKLEKNKKVVSLISKTKGDTSFRKFFPDDSLYTITISKDLLSESGEKLKDQILITFKTAKDKNQDIYSDKKLYSVLPDEQIKTTFYQDSQRPDESWKTLTATINIRQVPKEALLGYFTYKKGSSYFNSGNILYKIPQDSVTNEKTETYEKKFTNENQITTLEIPNPKKPGLYYVEINTVSGKYEDFFVSVGNFIARTASDQFSNYTWITDAKSGKSESGYVVTRYSLDQIPKIIDSKTTDVDGRVQFSGVDTEDLIIAEKNNDVLIVKLKDYFPGKGESYTVHSYLEKPVYRPGDIVHYKAVIRKRQNGSYVIPSGSLYVKIQVFDGQKSDYSEVSIDETGSVSYDFTLPKQSVSEYSYIRLAQKEGENYEDINTLDVKVKSYLKPDLDIQAITKTKEYVSKDDATIYSTVKTSYGSIMGNTPFTYRVVASDYSEVRDRKIESIDISALSQSYGIGKDFTSGDGMFDNLGKTTITFSTDLSQYESSQLITLEITPKVSASPGIARIAKLVHRGTYTIFFENTTAEPGADIKGKILTLNHETERKPVKGKIVDLTLFKSIMTGDTYEELGKTTVTTDDTGYADFSFPQKDNASYKIVAKSKDERENTITTNEFLSTIVQHQGYNEPKYNIVLSLNNKEFAAGDTAYVTANANFSMSDTLIFTYVHTGESMFWQKQQILMVTKQQPNNSVMRIAVPLEKSLKQNMRISVLANTDGMPVIGDLEIPIIQKNNRIETKISFEKTVVRPRDTVTVEIKTTDFQGNPVSVDNSLGLIDASILQIGKMNGDIFTTFFQKNTSSLAVYDSMTGIYNRRGGGGAGGCFVEGTLITMADKSKKPIEQIELGDQILTRISDFDSKQVVDKVTQTIRHIVDEYLLINNSFHVTPVHRIFLNHSWQTARSAKIGDVLLDENGNEVQITSIDQRVGQVPVYNLTTEKYHTFFAEKIYVHNEKGDAQRENFVDTVYWNPHIKTGADGKAQVKIKLPDNVTTYSALAISNSQDSRFGQGITELISKKNIVIIPALPTYFFQNDTPLISTLIQNNSDKNISGELTMTIKEIGFSKKESVNIGANEYTQVDIPVELKTTKGELSFTFDMSTEGESFDSVILKKQILMRDQLMANWQSFEGSRTFTFQPKTRLESNSAIIDLFPHLSYLITKKGFAESLNGFNYYDSPDMGLKLFTSSLILHEVDIGLIDPTLFNYAYLKNNVRFLFNELISRRSVCGEVKCWYPGEYEKILPELKTQLILKAFQEADQFGLLEEIKTIKEFLSEKYTTIPPKAVDVDIDSKFMSQWQQNTSLKSFDKYKVITADDRLMWDAGAPLLNALPALLTIEKGNNLDRQKAIKGLSFQYRDTYWDSRLLAIYASVVDLRKQNLNLSKPQYLVSVNEEEIINSEKLEDYANLTSHTVLPMMYSQNSANISVNVKSDLPVYSVVSSYEYGTKGKPSFVIDESSNSKTITKSLERGIREIQNGEFVDEIPSGETGIMEIKVTPSKIIGYLESNFIYIDSLSPGLMLFDQNSGNSPQYQKIIDQIYSSGDQSSYGNYFIPSNVSDQIVRFSGVFTKNPTYFIYPAYRISTGKHFQPKSAVIMPLTGVILSE